MTGGGDLIRPEVRRALYRWREVLAGLGLLAVGFWLAGLGGPFWIAAGALIGLAGLAVSVGGLRRLRFARGVGAPGVVQVVEGQVAYFGPEDGGFVALDDVTALGLARGASGPEWVLEQPGQPPLCVPVSADGAEALYDVFAALPGIDMQALTAALDAPPEAGKRMLWRRAHPAALT
ncbi:hypothetical protein C2I36_00690 [Rhodobacteraceae bacterium WD3A24]|nr:hypothetical protein C2I36_00690 [Rhodobacteraceae bacterium WD3A24]